MPMGRRLGPIWLLVDLAIISLPKWLSGSAFSFSVLWKWDEKKGLAAMYQWHMLSFKPCEYLWKFLCYFSEKTSKYFSLVRSFFLVRVVGETQSVTHRESILAIKENTVGLVKKHFKLHKCFWKYCLHNFAFFMTLFIAPCIFSACFFLFERSVVNGTANWFTLIYCYIVLLFPLVCVQHSGPEIKWVDGGKQLLKISTHLVSTVYTQVSYKTNLIREPFRNYVRL